MKLQTGEIAPHFEREDIFGERVDLRAYEGRSVLLSFLRHGGCALCNLRVHQLIQRYPELRRRGLEVLAIFEAPVESIKRYVTSRQDVPFHPSIPPIFLIAIRRVRIQGQAEHLSVVQPGMALPVFLPGVSPEH